MEDSNLQRRILSEMERLLARSCPKQKVPQKYKNLHVAILKNHYNAADVSIDYHRRRVEMSIVLDNSVYDPKTINLVVPTLHANLLFKNLFDFLKTCIDKDSRSLAFYANILRYYAHVGTETKLRIVI